MKAIVYLSSATALMTVPQLEFFLEKIRDKNLADSITGLLLYSDGNFMQLIEGSDETVSRTFSRIQSDPRHKGIIKLLDEPIDQRVFPDWKMAFLRVTRSELSTLSNACWQGIGVDANLSASNSTSLATRLSLLKSFWDGTLKNN